MKIDYNNIGIGTIAIGSVLNNCNRLSVAKMTLILPFIMHTECLYYLARASTHVKSIEKLIAERTSYFANFNARYYDSLCLSFSSIQYLTDMGYAKLKDGELIKLKDLDYDRKMGTRANKIFQAANNVSTILSENHINLFLNLRVDL